MLCIERNWSEGSVKALTNDCFKAHTLNVRSSLVSRHLPVDAEVLATVVSPSGQLSVQCANLAAIYWCTMDAVPLVAMLVARFFTQLLPK